jgi:hypothetical protein
MLRFIKIYQKRHVGIKIFQKNYVWIILHCKNDGCNYFFKKKFEYFLFIKLIKNFKFQYIEK